MFARFITQPHLSKNTPDTLLAVGALTASIEHHRNPAHLGGVTLLRSTLSAKPIGHAYKLYFCTENATIMFRAIILATFLRTPVA
jgi:hypothetical protein